MKSPLLFQLFLCLALASAAHGQVTGNLDPARAELDNSEPATAPALVFTSFRGNGEDGLHLAWSTNGYRWTALHDDRPFLRPTVGGRLMRDPCVTRGPDGTFQMVWTTGWTAEGNPVFGYASSPDLIDWSPQRAIPVMQNEAGTRNVWAPEIFFDNTRREYFIFWSSTIPGKFPETDPTGDHGYNHRVYFTTTRDFQTFAESRLFYDPGFNVIDATLLAAEGKYHLFIKDERKNPLQKNLRQTFGDTPTGPFAPLSEPITGDWVEGPSAIRIGDEYLLYFFGCPATGQRIAQHFAGARAPRAGWYQRSPSPLCRPPNPLRDSPGLPIAGLDFRLLCLLRDGRNLASVLNLLGTQSPATKAQVVELLSKVVPGVVDLTAPPNPEAIGGAKEWLEERLPRGQGYGSRVLPIK